MTRQDSHAEVLSSRISQSIRTYGEKLQAGETAMEEILEISSACKELTAHVTPPEIWTNQVAMSYNSSIALCLLLDLNIFQLLSDREEPTTLETLSKRSGASKALLRCALREAVAQYIIDEPSPEAYKLNARSAFLLESSGGAWIHHMCDVGLLIGAYVSRYVSQVKGQIPTHRHQSAFQMAYRTNQLFYPFIRSSDQQLGDRFDRAMQWHSRAAATTVESIFDFGQLRSDALVVDVGGGKGHHSIRIAQKHPRMSFVVQDQGAVSPSENDQVDKEVLKRVRWQQHDFYTEQPIKGADLYLLSCILMDHTLEDCRTMLQHIANAMKPNESVLVIDDAIDVGSKGSPFANAMNMHLLACFGTLSRTMDEWELLFSGLSPRLSIANSWMSDPGRVTFALKRTEC